MSELRAPSPGDVYDDRFVLEAPLGKGSFAAVWRASDHTRGDRKIALKILFERHTTDDKKRRRFVQEAQILERLVHPNIAQPIAWRASPEGAYLAMELIDGEPLDVRLEDHSARGAQIPPEAVAWMIDQLCAAVGYAHRENIVHRDLKPRNVMISRRGQRPFLKVLDFGIAKILLGSELDPTTVGKVLGSVLYIAPEQVLGQPFDHRADLFSIGTILFELLTLRRTWARGADGQPLPWHMKIDGTPSNSQIAILRRIAREPRPSVRALRPELPSAVEDVVVRALAIDPAERFASADELARALRLALVTPAPTPLTRGPVPHPLEETADDRTPLVTLHDTGDTALAPRAALADTGDTAADEGAPAAVPQGRIVSSTELEPAPSPALHEPRAITTEPKRRSWSTWGLGLLALAGLIAALAFLLLGPR
ncbi:serine/threonine protein kinase [Myxococcota bacterium]|nr:serine/threonine protein kinase [Myxococcota bacterium]